MINYILQMVRGMFMAKGGSIEGIQFEQILEASRILFRTL